MEGRKLLIGKGKKAKNCKVQKTGEGRRISRVMREQSRAMDKQ